MARFLQEVVQDLSDTVKAGRITPEDYGAKGDGKTDDRAALAAAIAAAGESGTPLELKRGAVYRFTAYLEIESNVSIIGNDAVLLSDMQYSANDLKSPNRPAVGVVGASNDERKHDITLSHVVFRAADTCQTNYMFRVMRGENMEFDHCVFDCDLNDYSRNTVDLYGAWENISFHGCTFRQLSACQEGGMWVRSWTSAVESRGCRIVDCDFYKAGGDEVLAVWGWMGTVKDVLISGCRFYEVEDEKYLSRGFYPAWFITLGQKGTTFARMEHCVVRVRHCESVFRMLGAGTHAVVDNCDIYSIQPDDMAEHDPNKGAHAMLVQGDSKTTGAGGSIIQNCNVTLTGDAGRKISYNLGTLRNNHFSVDIGTGPANTKEVANNVFIGKVAKGLFWDCDIVKNNTVDISLYGLSWMSGGNAVTGNNITLHVLNNVQGGSVFRNNWGAGTIADNRITIDFAEACDIRRHFFPVKNAVAQFVQGNVVILQGDISTRLEDTISGIVYRKNNYFNSIPEKLLECTGVSFDDAKITEQYKKYANLAVKITPEGCTDPVIYTWTNDEGAILDMEYGAYRPVQDGWAKVKVSCGMFEAEQEITVQLVPVACESISLNRATAKVGAGSMTYLNALVTPYWTTDEVVWSSDAETIAEVSQDGTVTAKTIGTANITVTCGSQSATCALKVLDPSEMPVYQDGEWVLDGTVAYIPLPNLAKEHSVYLSFAVDVDCVDTGEQAALISTMLSGQTGATPLYIGFAKDKNGYATVRWSTTDVDTDSDGKTVQHSVSTVNNGFSDVAETAFLYLRDGVANPGGAIVWNAEEASVKAAPNSGYLSFNVQTANSDKPVTNYSTGETLKNALTAGNVHASKATGFKIKELIVFANQQYSVKDDFIKYREGAEIDIRFDENGRVVNAGTAGEIVWSEFPESQDSGTVVPDQTEQNVNPFPSLTPAYMLPQEKTFTAANEEYIDTGVKLFESIDSPNFTILFEVQGGDALTASKDTFVAFHCMEEAKPWPGLTMQVLSDGNLQLCAYSTTPNFGTVDEWKAQKRRMAVRVQNGNLSGWRTDGYLASWGAISSMTTAVDKTLILGAYQTSAGVKGRFFDGTFYQFIVYDSALTDDQINGWIQE